MKDMPSARPSSPLLIVLLSLLALLSVPTPAAAGVPLDRVVAVVNKEALTWSELYLAMEFELARDMRPASPEEKKRMFKESEAAFLESMIEVRLQLQEASALGISASDKELAAAARGIREKYGLEEEAFLRAIAEQGFTEKKYMGLLREQITIRKLVEREVRDRVEVTDLDVEAYLASKGLKDGDQYRLRQIFLGLPKSEEEETAVAGKVSKVLEALKGGTDFASVAAAYSEAPGARATGGDMGFIEKENLAPEFVSALEGLAPGTYSAPFRTPGGVHVLMLEEKKGVRDVIFEQKFEEEHKRWLRALRSRAFIEVRL